jgi:histidyl-tRNA synthetase
VKPSLPKGTRDFGPEAMARRQFIIDSIRSVYARFGYQPLETPAMENLSTLSGKYGEEGDQLLFKILNSGDFLKEVDLDKPDQRSASRLTAKIAEKGLRYDLTVPFARFVVMNRNEITFPFRRYQIQPVWRADRPQKGRYREFYQCDADVVGTDSLVCEMEIVQMIREAMNALSLRDYTIRINHRALLGGLAEVCGFTQKENDLFVAIDKLEKAGEDAVKAELKERGFPADKFALLFSALATPGSNEQKLAAIEQTLKSSKHGLRGVGDLRQLLDLLKASGTGDEHLDIDFSLARGLSYYTGCIFEVKLHYVAVGSVSGGGRYDNLTGVFGMPGVSGVGFSFGIDRLYDAMAELNLFPPGTGQSSRVLVAHLDAPAFRYALGVLARLRAAGIASEIYPDPAKVKKQLEYADRKKIAFSVVIGEEEVKTGNLTVKRMETGEQSKMKIEALIHELTSE